MYRKIFSILIFFILCTLVFAVQYFFHNRGIPGYVLFIVFSYIVFTGIFIKLIHENFGLKYLVMFLETEIKRYKSDKDLSSDNFLLAKQRERFIATLNHDLKTPAIAQVRSLDLILSGNFGNLNAEQYNMIKLTKESCQDMLDIIVTVLDNYKFENHQMPICGQSIDLVEIVERCCIDLKDVFAAKNICVKIFPDKNLYKVPGDIILLQRAVSNIIENSVSYAYENSTVLIKIHNTGMNACISVANEGILLPEDILNKLFDPYECNSSMYNKIGFGIKLYLAQQIVQAHDGGIIARNESYGGTVFDIILPMSDIKHSVMDFSSSGVLAENISA